MWDPKLTHCQRVTLGLLCNWLSCTPMWPIQTLEATS